MFELVVKVVKVQKNVIMFELVVKVDNSYKTLFVQKTLLCLNW